MSDKIDETMRERKLFVEQQKSPPDDPLPSRKEFFMDSPASPTPE